jgi:integrase
MAELTQNASTSDCIFGTKAGPNLCKSESADRSAGTSPLCPKCHSKKVWRDAHRYSVFGDKIQRWLCRECGHRFSDPEDVQKSWSNQEKAVRTAPSNEIIIGNCIVTTRQICVEETKNLGAEQQTTEVLRGNTGDIKGRLVEFAWWMKKEGFRDANIFGRSRLIKILHRRGADLYDPESVKAVIAKQKWCEGRKANAVDSYSTYLKMVGGTWTAPKYKPVRKIPFVPKETEIDQLIAGCSPRVATFLQLLKETGARGGEIWMLEQNWIDYEANTVSIAPEKDSNPRIFHISQKLMGMIRNLPKGYDKFVFSRPEMPLDHFRDNFTQQRKRIAFDLQSPRLQRITFKTMRTWKGTMEYHRTKDILYVMSVLGYKNIKNTLLYIQLEEALFKDEIDHISKVAQTENEALVLIEAGFEFVCDFDGHKLFKKRKN